MTNSQILSELDQVQITQFDGCGHIGIRTHNLLLNFTKQKFKVFSNSFQSINFNEHTLIFSDDQERLIMNTPIHSIQLCFTHNEFDIFKQALVEASIILETQQLLD